MTIAEKIAGMFNNDGLQKFNDRNRTYIGSVCESVAVNKYHNWNHGATRWHFEDGSWLAIVGDCWFTDMNVDGVNCYWPGERIAPPDCGG